MTVKSYQVGPGTLTLGTATDGLFDSQLTNLRVEPTANITRSDPRKVLSGEERVGRRKATYTFKLAGSLLQDIEVGGVIDFTWINRGLALPFIYVPNDSIDRCVGGIVYVDPLLIGGEVDSADDPTADFSWDIEGTPIFDTADIVGAAVQALV